MIKLNQSVARSFPIFLLILLLFVGCGDNDNDLPETATVMVEVSAPKVLKPTDALRLIVSTDLNTKEEFSITQDFNQTFQLDPDTPRIYVQLINPGPSVSVRLTVLIDGEVEYDETELLTSGSSIGFSRSFIQ